ncbi:uncharacterized protein LDX57_001941 [Aspergillus melleus]|uniref:uncharacterized protein n=1 Tax=Aspergillus melleus TaxID=138277 RepID=UPI001E8E1DAC|nr:uncharacterized protein LDX57_001941 [Aspergillus melleus]KAH8424186.1 hypothetical protein LDX57_001941 [Aspergillus melleus]
MPSLKTLLPVLLSLATATIADNSDNCPHNWLSNRYKDRRCCYGNMLIEDTTAYCCVYEVYGYEELATMSFPTETASTSTEHTWSKEDGCFTKIPFTASDYSARVSSASDAIAASKTKPASNEAASTSGSTSSATGLASTSASASASGSESSTNAAMPVATAQGMVLGGAALAAALFV